ncbi:hypothetical protein [Actinomyces procaprae]|uniref:hypothetical protein n=1 Tax=Actinomyces procaprae TaxID=2560010 RepID=UPI00109DB9ED|nr:hypothetical protein [Actinomyces procaprae]
MDTRESLGHDYLPRVVDAQLDRLLEVGGAVVIEGTRACGKTMTGLNAARPAPSSTTMPPATPAPDASCACASAP